MPHRPLLRSLILALAFVGAATAVGAQDGKPFRDCADCPELVVIPAGAFDMGAIEIGRNANLKRSQPLHRVTIPKAFAFGRYEITFDEWEACRRDGGCSRNPDDHGWGRGRRPVINVSIPDVEEYVRWLSKKTGETYRLPTEAEWEYAARAGTRSRFSWGEEAGKDNANCRTCAPEISKMSVEVGRYKPNPWGLFDVHGNVWEWTQDCWNESYQGAPVDGSAWKSGDCNFRVQRGGSWYYVDANLDSAFRSKYAAAANGISYGIGFRVVREMR